MKTLIVLITLFGTADLSNAQNVNILDTAFLNALIDDGVDTNGDSLISYEEAEAVTYLDVSGSIGCGAGCSGEGDILSLEGIGAFINIDTLDCSGNHLKFLDVSDIENLSFLNCCYNNLENLNVTGCKNLSVLNLTGNDLTELDLSTCNALEYLYCGIYRSASNKLSELDVSNNLELEGLCCAYNELTNLNISGCSKLKFLYCNVNHLTALDVSNSPELKDLSCSNNKIATLDLSNNIALVTLDCIGNEITSLNLINNTALKYLDCSNMNLGFLDISNNTLLEDLLCRESSLQSLDISNNKKLIRLDCFQNQLTHLDVSRNASLKELICGSNHLTSLNLSNNKNLFSDYLTGPAFDYNGFPYNDDVPYDLHFGLLNLSFMASLHEVCVWEGFKTNITNIDLMSSPNVCFETDCNGVCGNTEIEEYINETLSIFPNPAISELTIEFEKQQASGTTFELLDISGKVVYSGIINPGETLHHINLSSFEEGLYLIRISNSDYTVTKKVIKVE